MLRAFQRFSILIAVCFLLVYTVWMLGVDCLPLSDVLGEFEPVARWQFWLVVTSDPYAIWLHWTGGTGIAVFADRIEILAYAVGWLLLGWWVGTRVLRLDGLRAMDRSSDKLSRNCLAVLVGSALVSAAIFLWGIAIGTEQRMLLIALLAGLALGAELAARRVAHEVVTSDPKYLSLDDAIEHAPQTPEEWSLHSWSRRLAGLLFVASFFLGGLHVYGAAVPSCDQEVRESDWTAIRHYLEQGRIRELEEVSEYNRPKSTFLHALASASLMGRDRSDGPVEHGDTQLLRGMIVGKVVQASLFVLSTLFLVAHLTRCYGMFPSLLTLVAILATPGLMELHRLGRTEAIGAMWGIVLWILLTSRAMRTTPSAGMIAIAACAGAALGSGFGTALFIALPALVWLASIVWGLPGSRSRLWCNFLFIVIALLPIGWWWLSIQQPVWLQRSIGELHFLSSVSAMCDDSLRTMGMSHAHGLLWIPTAILGTVVLSIAVDDRKRWVVPAVLVIAWLGVWCVMRPHFDRQWVAILPWLAWSVCAGFDWLHRRGGWIAIVPYVAIGLIWSLVVMPIWPWSDNRILASIDQIQSPYVVLANLPSYQERYQAFLNQSWHSEQRSLSTEDSSEPMLAQLNERSKVLVIGDANVFDVRAKCVVSGPRDISLWDEFAQQLDQLSADPKLVDRWRQRLRENGITHIVLAWSGLRSREVATGVYKEEPFRKVLHQLQEFGHLLPISWQGSSTEGDIFLVND